MTSAIYYTLVSSRPTTWIRIFAEMLFGFAFANNIDIGRFLLGFFAAGPLLWSGAYILNDLTDIKYDQEHRSRKNRPITVGRLSSKAASMTTILLFLLSLFLGIFISKAFVVGLILLAVSQIIYTLPPFRLKEKPVVDIFLNGANGGVRFYLGFLTANNHISQAPFFFMLFAIFLKAALFVGHRMQNRDIELRNHFKSTITLFSLQQLKSLLLYLFVFSGLLYIFSIFYYSLSLLMLIPPVISVILAQPLLFATRKGYLEQQERNIFARVYLYLILLVFSLQVLFILRV